MSQILFRLPTDVKHRLKIAAAKRNKYVSQILGELIEKFLRDEEG